MPRAVPPFRADHVGSLLRPPELLRTREDDLVARFHDPDGVVEVAREVWG
jgi:5-methyltetrahydropteroyltriglutamate--homocysteine methyltransferase